MKHLERIRMSRGLSREALGQLIGVTRQSVRNWELGITQPSMMIAMITAKVLDTTIEQLFDKESNHA